MTNSETDGKQLSVVQKKMLEMEQLKQRVADAKAKRLATATKNLTRNGRKKGAKGKATLLREAVLAKAENMVLEDWTEVVETTLEMAKGGDTTALKILWDRVIPSKRAVDGAGGDAASKQIVINISGMEVAKVLDEPVIEADFVEVEDGDT